MKKIMIVLLATILAVGLANDVFAQKTKKPATRKITLTSKETGKELIAYGVKDSLVFRVIGTATKNWDVNLKCVKRKATTMDWYETYYHEYYYKGMDGLYIWELRFLNADDIILVQKKMGTSAAYDTFVGKYE